MDWSAPLTVALVVAASVGALLLQNWSLKRARQKKAERDAELGPPEE